jgi:hypothetical protein|tara:strand:+ start:843 stop:1241 length:399 start_codon:yes stop_codon:yes gene_type:complete
MSKFTIAFGSATFLIAAGSAFADNHAEMQPAASDTPERTACMEMHEWMMARHEAGEDHETIMNGMSEEDQALAESCHAMMQADGHGEGHHDMEHGEGHGDGHGNMGHDNMGHDDMGHGDGHEAGAAGHGNED